MTNDVYLKDLHFDYLQKKGFDFAKTDTYKEHEILFDSLKEKVNETDSQNKENNDVPRIVIDFLKDMIVNKYFDTDQFTLRNPEISRAAWFYLQAKARLANKMKKNFVKFNKVNSSMSELDKTDSTIVLHSAKESYSLEAYLKSSHEKNPVGKFTKKPDETDNHVHDVIKFQKFYEEVSINPIKYDDLAFSIMSDILAEKKNYQIPFNPEYMRKRLAKTIKSSTESYEINSHIKWVKDSLIEKYYSSSITNRGQDSLFTGELLKKSMLRLLKQANNKTFHIDTYFSSDFVNNTLTFTFDKEYTENVIYNVSVSNSNDVKEIKKIDNRFVLTLNKDVPFSFSVLYHDNNESISLKRIFSKRFFSIERFLFTDSLQWKVPICDFMEGYLLEYDKTGLINETCEDGILTINFDSPKSGDLLVLNNFKNNTGRKVINLSNYNVRTVLKSLDFSKDRFVIWTQ